MQLIYYRVLSLIGSVLLCTAFIYAQEKAPEPERDISTVSVETYRQVLDVLFPRAVLRDGTARYSFVLRYEPSFSAESQITIVDKGGKIEVIKYTSEVGNIFAKLNSLKRPLARAKPEQIAKLIKVQKRVLNLSPERVKQLRRSFFDSLNSSLQSERNLPDIPNDAVTITADGTDYRLWYKGDGNIQYTFGGSDVTAPIRLDEPPLMGWMKSVYQIVN